MAPASRPSLYLALFTLLVWTTRIRNIWTDDSLTDAGRLGRTALSLSFTVFAVVTVVWVVRSRSAAPSGLRWWIRAFAAWTVVVWAVRVVGIATADHEIGFVVVHTVLAVVSVALALWADRRVRARG